MRNLTAMLGIDTLHIRATLRRSPLIFLVALIISSLGGMYNAGIILYLLITIIATHAFTIDDTHKLVFFYSTLPVSRKTVVTSHYVLAAAAVGVALIAMFIFAGISSIVRDADITSELLIGMTTMIVASILVAISIPIIANYGTRAVFYASVAFVALAFAAAFLGSSLRINVAPVVEFIYTHQSGLLIGGIIATIAIWVLSWALTCRIYSRKEF